MNAVDTNVFVYAATVDDSAKSASAAALIDRLPPDETVILRQVLCEFGAAMERLRRRGLAAADAQDAIDACRFRFPIILASLRVFDEALRLNRERSLPYWDALLVSACLDAGADVLYTEDLQAGERIDGLRVVNPFAKQPPIHEP